MRPLLLLACKPPASADRAEYTDPAEPKPLTSSSGGPAIDIDRVTLEGDGEALVFVIHLTDTLTAFLKADEKARGLSTDPAWIYLDTDDNGLTGGFTGSNRKLGGFEYEVKILSMLGQDGAPDVIYDLAGFQQDETSWDMDDRRSAEGPGSRTEALQASAAHVTVAEKQITVRIPYAAIDVSTGARVRVRMREHDRGPWTPDRFFPDLTVVLR